ncbi:MAG TPA: hypothetical protein VGP76_03650 [Planctomycetaceae bacterium]|jgi:hypothetical protein|nr:hypothetical protein [Planctomycetaceae bacterium]
MSVATLTFDALADTVSMPARFTPKSLAFAGILLFVGAVSVYDGYLVLRTGYEICQFERNPVGLWLIAHNHGDPAVFLMAKGIGTFLVLVCLTWLYRRAQRIAFPVGYALALFQSGLLVYLQNA